MDKNIFSLKNERFRKMFYKYCFHCEKCQRYQKRLYNASLGIYPADLIHHHSYKCCKEKKELQKEIEKEIELIKTEEEKRKNGCK